MTSDGTPILIGLTGKAGSGKSTLANMLVTQYGFTKLAFADPLKEMLRVLLRAYGMDEDMAERFINGDLKEAHCPALGTSSRYAQQELGTEWGRDRISPNLWVNILVARMDRMRAQGAMRFVIDDVRMENEARMVGDRVSLWRTGGLYRMEPLGEHRRQPPAHRSEDGLPSSFISATIKHDYTLAGLHAVLEETITKPFKLDEGGSKWQTL